MYMYSPSKSRQSYSVLQGLDYSLAQGGFARVEVRCGIGPDRSNQTLADYPRTLKHVACLIGVIQEQYFFFWGGGRGRVEESDVEDGAFFMG